MKSISICLLWTKIELFDIVFLVVQALMPPRFLSHVAINACMIQRNIILLNLWFLIDLLDHLSMNVNCTCRIVSCVIPGQWCFTTTWF